MQDLASKDRIGASIFRNLRGPNGGSSSSSKGGGCCGYLKQTHAYRLTNDNGRSQKRATMVKTKQKK
jgi:hypothetical protein